MSEKEKMLRGEPYFSFGDELAGERLRAKEVLFEVNNLPPSAADQRHDLLRGLFGSVGERFYIEPPFRCDYGYNIHWGEGSYANYNLVILDCNKVVIGDQVLIGPNVSIYTAGHPVDPVTRAQDIEFAKPVTIGNRVWLGGGAILNPGVTIGDNTVIGAGSVVTKDIPANVVAVGNPCRVLRQITAEEVGKPPQA